MHTIDIETQIGSVFPGKTSRHEAWTGDHLDTSVARLERVPDDRTESAMGTNKEFWLALSRGAGGTVFAGHRARVGSSYGPAEYSTEWRELPADVDLPGRLLSEDDTTRFWQAHQPDLSRQECTLAALRLMESLRSGRNRDQANTVLKTDATTKEPLMVLSTSAAEIHKYRTHKQEGETDTAPAWAKLDSFLHPPTELGLSGGVAAWCPINRPDLVLVVNHLSDDRTGGKAAIGTVFSMVTGHSASCDSGLGSIWRFQRSFATHLLSVGWPGQPELAVKGCGRRPSRRTDRDPREQAIRSVSAHGGDVLLGLEI